MKFIKLQYKNIIKKVLLTENELTWDHLCEIIMNSFSLKDKDRIFLKYIDFEKEEVTVDNEKALVSALNIYFVQKFIKFFVYYSGVFQHQNSQASAKISQSIEASHQILEAPNPNNPVLVLNMQEIQEIFSSAFEQAKIFKFIQKGLLDLIEKKVPETKDPSNVSVEYAVHSDYFSMAEYFKTVLTSTLQRKYEDEKNIPINENENQPEILPKIQLSHKVTEKEPSLTQISSKVLVSSEREKQLIISNRKEKEEEEKKENEEKNENEENKEEEKHEGLGLDRDSSVVESIYEIVENKETESSILTDPANFFSPCLKKSVSEQNPGRKLVVAAVENNGKVNFTSKFPTIEEFPMEKKRKNKDLPEFTKSISDISFDFLSFHQTVKPEINMKNNFNKYEFTENILQENEHCLDLDLPAPYLFEK